MEWVSACQASKIIGVTAKTLRGWNARGLIDTARSPTGQRLYDVRKYQGKTEEKKDGGHRVIYARVSCTKQQEDLERQAVALRAEFLRHQAVRDIGSGINCLDKLAQY